MILKAEKNARANALIEIKRLSKEFGFAAGMLKGALAIGRGFELAIHIRLFLNGYTRQLAPSLAVLGWIGQVQPTFMPLMDESVRMVSPVG